MVTIVRRSHAFAGLLFAGLLGWALPSTAAEPDTTRSTVTDLLGRQVKVHLPVRRVILGEGRQLYLVAALDTQNPIERIVGWRKDLIQSDPDTYGAYLRKFPDIAKIPTFGGFEDGTFDIEQAISQHPDVIILNIEAQHATEDARYIEKLDALGIPVVYVDFRNHPMQNTEPTMRLFGQLLVIADGTAQGSGASHEVITEHMLRKVYQVEARIEQCSRGQRHILIDGIT